MRLSLLALLCLALPALAAPGSNSTSFADVAEVSMVFDPPSAKPGQIVTLKLTVSPKKDCYTYPVNVPKDQAGKNEIEPGRFGDFALLGPVTDPRKGEEKDPENGNLDLIYKKPVTWELKLAVSPTATPGKKPVTLEGTSIQACNKSNCLYLKNPAADLEVLAGPAEPLPPEVAKLFAEAPKPPEVVPTPVKVPEKSAAGLVQKTGQSPDEYALALEALRSRIEAAGPTGTPTTGGFATLLLAAAFWGFVSLVTPCVFPMIPITVSLFLKQSHQSTAQVLKLAGVYCLTIVLVLGASAIFLLSAFRELSVNPVMNLFLGGLFVFFALSLFGMYDIALPGFLLRSAEKRRSSGGLVGTVFGALAFSIVSFTCVAPFLGGFAGMAASGNFNTLELAAAGVVFATAFASPFFVLALFPSLLKKLPKSGGWLDTVKAVMGFLELAAAFKFFRTAELRLLDHPAYFTYDFTLAAWVAISAATGAYLLNLYRLPHDDEQPTVGVPRLVIALAFLSLSVYLAPALIKPTRPSGAVYAWVDAFLLPEPASAAGEELPWSTDLVGAVDRIAKEKRTGTPTKPLIFVDFTGVTCSNCKLNEKDVFPQPKVKDLLSQYTLVQMYTDEVPVEFYATTPPRLDRKREADANQKFQQAAFGTIQLPLYAILEPQTTGSVKVLGVYDEGKINDVSAFVAFLKKPLGK